MTHMDVKHIEISDFSQNDLNNLAPRWCSWSSWLWLHLFPGANPERFFTTIHATTHSGCLKCYPKIKNIKYWSENTDVTLLQLFDIVRSNNEHFASQFFVWQRRKFKSGMKKHL